MVRGLRQAFEAFGGVPLVAVWDNPQTVVVSRKKDLIVWNPVFGQVAPTTASPPSSAGPERPSKKARSRISAAGSKGSFFKCRRFHDRADLERQLRDWLTETNTQRPSRATRVIPAVRLAPERPRLRPLPIPAAEYALTIPVRVSA